MNNLHPHTYTISELIEDEKLAIQMQIDETRRLRDSLEVDSDGWNFFDKRIDDLLIQKDNVSRKYREAQEAAEITEWLGDERGNALGLDGAATGISQDVIF